MYIATGAFLLTVVIVVISIKKELITDKRILLIAVIIAAAGTGYSLYEGYSSGIAFENRLTRNPTGGGSYERELTAGYSGNEYEVTVNVPEKAPTEEEAYVLVDQAIAEIEATFLKDNESTDNVCSPVCVEKSYADKRVDCEWSFDDKGVMNPDGSIRLEKLAGPTAVTAYALLTCGEASTTYELKFTVRPPSSDTEAGFRYRLGLLLDKSNKENPYSEALTLPETLDNKDIIWRSAPDNTGMELSLLGPIILIAMIIGSREEKKRKAEKKMSELSRDYPNIVNRLSLFVGAGISVKAAFERIGNWYIKNRPEDPKQSRPGFEAVLQVNRRIADGISEAEAYRLFGADTGHKNYRKLSLLLRQNLKKGSRDMIDQLEKEERIANDEQKLYARIAGEEASTKLLLPMLMMLGVLLAILIIPAITGMNI